MVPAAPAQILDSVLGCMNESCSPAVAGVVDLNVVERLGQIHLGCCFRCIRFRGTILAVVADGSQSDSPGAAQHIENPGAVVAVDEEVVAVEEGLVRHMGGVGFGIHAVAAVEGPCTVDASVDVDYLRLRRSIAAAVASDVAAGFRADLRMRERYLNSYHFADS